MSFIPNAYADGAAAATSGSSSRSLMQFFLLVVIFALFWLLLIRPQQKKMKLHNQMLSSLGKGDKVVTTGGIIGKIIKTFDNGSVDLEIANNVVVKLQRSAISGRFEEVAVDAPKEDVAK